MGHAAAAPAPEIEAGTGEIDKPGFFPAPARVAKLQPILPILEHQPIHGRRIRRRQRQRRGELASCRMLATVGGKVDGQRHQQLQSVDWATERTAMPENDNRKLYMRATLKIMAWIMVFALAVAFCSV